MGENVFGRKYSLIVDKKSDLLGRALVSPTPANGLTYASGANITESTPIYYTRPLETLFPDKDKRYASWRDYGGEQIEETHFRREFTSLQMEAEVEYTSEKTSSSTQTTEVKIYNLSLESLIFIGVNDTVELRAGYISDKSLPLVFSGQIVSVTTDRVGLDNITTMVCQDSAVVTKNVNKTLSFQPGVKYNEIIDEMIYTLHNSGMVIGQYERAAKSADPFFSICTGGYSVEGNLMDSLVAVCNQVKYRAYLLLGKLYVEPRFRPLRVATVSVNSRDIKGRITTDSDTSKKTPKQDNNTSGVKLTTPLNGGVDTRRMLEVGDTRFAGSYKIVNVTHKLSYEGSAWDTTLVGRKEG